MRAIPKNFIPEPFQYHEEIELTVQALTNEGRGIGRVNNWIIMVPFVIPGERVRVRIFRNHKNYSEADLVEILEASPQRIQAKCPLFGKCGGCQYQHIAYAEQLAWKRQQVVDCLERIGKVKTDVQPLIPSKKTFHYRTKLTPHFDRRGKECPIGFLAEGSRFYLVDVPQCEIASEAINSALPELRETVKNSQQRNGTLLLRDCDGCIITDPNAIGISSIGNLKFKFPAGSFFQNNPYILESILQFLSGWLQQHTELKFLVDAYCGTGVFGLALARYIQAFMGIEIDEKSIKLAQENMQINHVENGKFIAGDACTIFKDVSFNAEQTFVIMDPPRKGASDEFLEQIAAFAPKAIVYISCAPHTQARDLNRLLTKAPAYHLTKVQPFDMFPQTKHMECIAFLER